MLDLHLHTIYSDGELTPLELIRLIQSKGVTTFSITDHDCILGLEEGRTIAKEYNLNFITGSEFEAYYDIESESYVHILGYGFSDTTEISRYLTRLRKERLELIDNYIRLLNTIGFQVSFEEINALTPGLHLTSSHIAAVIQNKGYAATFDEAKKKFLIPSSKYYIPRNYYTVDFVINLIIKSGGIPVLAHPCRIKMNRDEVEKFISKLKLHGLMGIEAMYLDSTSEQKDFFISLAKKYNLLITAGSDWHSYSDRCGPGVELPRDIEYKILEGIQ